VTVSEASETFHGTRTVVTGGARGIGAAIVAAFVERGASVFSADIREPAEQRPGVIDVDCDVTHRSDIDRLVETTDRAGGIDVLVNNAATTAVHFPWLEIDDDDWRAVTAVNLQAPFELARAFREQLARAGAGRIVNIGSIVTVLGPPGVMHYAATKAGLVGLTRSLAREFGPAGVTVNLVSPGAIETESEEEANTALEARGVMPMNVFAQQAIQRRGKKNDVANAVLFLASPHSGFITGQTLAVDGGWTMQ
jgi:3-oxoacyl-[acyl-carrier protein] reductase